MTARVERRFVEGVRVRGRRRLRGWLARYGDVAEVVRPDGSTVRERLASGALVVPSDVILTRDHRRDRPLARTGGGGLELRADARGVQVRAKLAPTSLAEETVQLVKAHVLRGFSPEFVVREERSEGGVRVIERALLAGFFSVVDEPAYGGSLVEARFVVRNHRATNEGRPALARPRWF